MGWSSVGLWTKWAYSRDLLVFQDSGGLSPIPKLKSLVFASFEQTTVPGNFSVISLLCVLAHVGRGMDTDWERGPLSVFVKWLLQQWHNSLYKHRATCMWIWVSQIFTVEQISLDAENKQNSHPTKNTRYTIPWWGHCQLQRGCAEQKERRGHSWQSPSARGGPPGEHPAEQTTAAQETALLWTTHDTLTTQH